MTDKMTTPITEKQAEAMFTAFTKEPRTNSFNSSNWFVAGITFAEEWHKLDAAVAQPVQPEPPPWKPAVDLVQHALFAQMKEAQPVEPDWLLSSTQDLAKHLARRCYPEVPQFEVMDDLAGVISQIDNMTTGMERKPVPSLNDLDYESFLAALTDPDDRMFEQIDLWTRQSYARHKSSVRGQMITAGDNVDSHRVWAALRWAKEFAQPAPSTWVGLTDAEMQDAGRYSYCRGGTSESLYDIMWNSRPSASVGWCREELIAFAQAVEAKYREKNSD